MTYFVTKTLWDRDLIENEPYDPTILTYKQFFKIMCEPYEGFKINIKTFQFIIKQGEFVNIGLVCASTTLAATMFEGAKTAHSLFKFPVSDDDEIDLENPNECRLKKY